MGRRQLRKRARWIYTGRGDRNQRGRPQMDIRKTNKEDKRYVAPKRERLECDGRGVLGLKKHKMKKKTKKKKQKKTAESRSIDETEGEDEGAKGKSRP